MTASTPTSESGSRERTRVPLPGFGPTRVFRAETMRDAFMRIKESIGPEAVILTTRDLGPSVVPDERFEVVAALPSETPDLNFHAGDSHAGPVEPRHDRMRTLPDALRKNGGHPNTQSTSFAPNASSFLPPLSPKSPLSTQANEEPANEARLTRQLAQLEAAIKALESQLSQLTEKDRRLREDINRLGQTKALLEEDSRTSALIARGLDRDVAELIVDRAVRRATPRNGLAVAKPPDVEDEVSRIIRVSRPLWGLDRGAVCAIIGPAGSGKTTTLLKLAGLSRFAHRKSVGLISTDTERIGQLELLETYATVMGLPIIAARDRGDVERALETFADKDLVLIDTPGHNPFDDNARFAALKPVSGREVRHHLIVPATLSARLAREIVSVYEGPALESLIGTHMDTVSAPSALMAACIASELPVSHLSRGREIPDDISAADAYEMSQMMFRRAS